MKPRLAYVLRCALFGAGLLVLAGLDIADRQERKRR